MQISPTTAIGSVCLHPRLGAGVLRANEAVNSFGVDVRLIEISFPDKNDWQFFGPGENFLEIFPPSVCPIGAA